MSLSSPCWMYSADIQQRAGWEGITAEFLGHQAASGLCKPRQGAGVLALHVGDTVTLGDTLTPCPRLLRHHDLASYPSGSVQRRGLALPAALVGALCCSSPCPSVPSTPSSTSSGPPGLHSCTPNRPLDIPGSGLVPKRVLSPPHPGACGVASTRGAAHPSPRALGCVCSWPGLSHCCVLSVQGSSAGSNQGRAAPHLLGKATTGVGCFTSGLC